MSEVQITWQRTCEYVATIDTAELRELVSRLPRGGAQGAALRVLETLEGCASDDFKVRAARELSYIVSNTETGREYLGAMADDNPDLLGGTGVPEITDMRPAR